MPTYTLTTGETPKLVATDPATEQQPAGVSRTVTTLRDLDPAAAAQLAVDLSGLTNALAWDTYYWQQFVEHASSLGVRAAQLASADAGLTLSQLADLQAPAGTKWARPKHQPVAAIGRILTTAASLPAPAQRAVRTELRTILAMFDGPVVPFTVGGLDGPNCLNVVEFCHAATGDDIAGLVLDGGRGQYVTVEDIAVFYSAPGSALEGLDRELEAAGWDINADLVVDGFVRHLARCRPEDLAAVVAGVDTDDLDPVFAELVVLAREQLTAGG